MKSTLRLPSSRGRSFAREPISGFVLVDGGRNNQRVPHSIGAERGRLSGLRLKLPDNASEDKCHIV